MIFQWLTIKRFSNETFIVSQVLWSFKLKWRWIYLSLLFSSSFSFPLIYFLILFLYFLGGYQRGHLSSLNGSAFLEKEKMRLTELIITCRKEREDKDVEYKNTNVCWGGERIINVAVRQNVIAQPWSGYQDITRNTPGTSS